jgi:hypothetical protein
MSQMAIQAQWRLKQVSPKPEESALQVEMQARKQVGIDKRAWTRSQGPAGEGRKAQAVWKGTEVSVTPIKNTKHANY